MCELQDGICGMLPPLPPPPNYREKGKSHAEMAAAEMHSAASPTPVV